ncbi:MULTISPECIES: response regulator transcription factor [Paenibacillus]|uniref:DNA-binding response regulator n=1 Tax=Paenibacillus campinasensis TaxID=66347 RepID=A0A268EPE3_9BACL|nr:MULTISPECIES: response regulator transcription factor [Paenibacillus]PAD74982.1 DNA-binding response regulator [Paenibacillus campinasensis]PAK50184.1 DNA-binding response regulator [Paenibacillus sp. 7541]
MEFQVKRQKKHTILVADDETEIVELLRLFLEREHYRVLEAYSGREAWHILSQEHVDLALVDIMMPELDGFQLIARIREKLRLPVIIVSAKTGDVDKVTGLALGADDFISKPFSPIEVVARIKAQLRRYYELNEGRPLVPGADQPPPSRTVCGPLTLDHRACMLYKRGEAVQLGPLEYKLLQLFMGAPGRIFTKRQIYEAVWNEPYFEDSNTVMVQISRLRDKLEDNARDPRFLVTIKGLGYKLALQGDDFR